MWQEPNTYSRRWMGFVDGENLTIRGQKCLDEEHVLPAANAEPTLYQKDTFVWFPGLFGVDMVVRYEDLPEHMQRFAIRSYYYTTVVGDEPKVQSVRENLWQLGFQPEVFRKPKRQIKAKGVDIALTKDMLSNAYFGNYDIALLYAGDGDYVPLVEEVKRLGKLVYTLFFEKWTHDELRLASDGFVDIEERFIELWQARLGRQSLEP
jgi:uncharacterized LabA/DUF88 family protein